MKRFNIYLLVLPLVVACATPPKSGAIDSSNHDETKVIEGRVPNQTNGPVCDVRKFGAFGDGHKLDTAAIQNAVNHCKGRFGTVVFTPGVYLSGMIVLGSNMTFHLDPGATLLGIRGDKPYPPLNPKTTNSQLLNCRKALLFADGAVNLTIEGPGTIDGNGGWKAWQGNIKEFLRPMPLFIFQTTGLTIRNLGVKNAAMWSVVLMESSHTLVDGLRVNSPNGPTRDGLDIVDGHDIIVKNAEILSQDDSICLKSGLNPDDQQNELNMPEHSPTVGGPQDFGLQRVLVQNSTVHGSLVANGLKFGTASRGIVKDIRFTDIALENVKQAAMAVESVDGAKVENVTFNNIKFNDVGAAFYVILGWRGNQQDAHPGSISQIEFDNITGATTKQTWGSAVSGSVVNGTTVTPSDIRFTNVNLEVKGAAGKLPTTPPEYTGQYPDPRLWGDLPASGIFFRHVKQVHLDNVHITNLTAGDFRPTLVPNNSANVFDVP